MKLIELVKAVTTLSEIGSKELPFALQHKIAKFMYSTQSDVDFYRDKFRELLSTYFVKSEIKEGEFKLKHGIDIEECNAKQDEINDIEVECPRFFTEEELKPLNLTLPQMLTLYNFIKE